MMWNWQKPDWPHFKWDKARLSHAEEQFLLEAGVAIGTVKHLGEGEHTQLLVELMSAEAVTTSAIEGEILNPGKRAVVDPASTGVGACRQAAREAC
jgi:Fic family protein